MNKEPEEDEDFSEDSQIDKIRDKFPEYSDESVRAGAFIGLDYPYVAGDD